MRVIEIPDDVEKQMDDVYDALEVATHKFTADALRDLSLQVKELAVNLDRLWQEKKHTPYQRS